MSKLPVQIAYLFASKPILFALYLLAYILAIRPIHGLYTGVPIMLAILYGHIRFLTKT